jgi:CRISPR system Cascade subunit CasE
MIYLSRLLLDPRARPVRRDIGDCQELHRTVLSAFPDTAGKVKAREEFAVLHRLDLERDRATLVVQSAVEPRWDGLPPEYLLPRENNPACKPVARLYAGLGSGVRLRFRLRANPTKRLNVAHPGGRLGPGKRVDIRREEEQLAWLARKGQQGGFTLCRARAYPDITNVRSVPSQAIGDRRGGPSPQKPRLVFGAVTFDGVLEITDAEAFRRTLTVGIGSGKAYGFGLLSIAPLRE